MADTELLIVPNMNAEDVVCLPLDIPLLIAHTWSHQIEPGVFNLVEG